MRKTQTGKFTPIHPEKYKGNSSNIIYRSSWERRVMLKLDLNSSIISWASEEICIRYLDPVTMKIRRYFPDFVIKAKSNDGKEKIIVLEVKPLKQTMEPVKRHQKTKTYTEEVKTYLTNTAKWEAAKKYCAEQGFEFVIFTEKEIL